MSYKLVKRLAQKGKRIFTTDEAREIGKEIDLNPDTIIDRLYDLHKKEMIERLMKGLYSRLEEIIAEKIRAILQFAEKLHERGWGPISGKRLL